MNNQFKVCIDIKRDSGDGDDDGKDGGKPFLNNSSVRHCTVSCSIGLFLPCFILLQSPNQSLYHSK